MESYLMGNAVYRIRRMTTDDSTTINTRLLHREFGPKTRTLGFRFLVQQNMIPTNLTTLLSLLLFLFCRAPTTVFYRLLNVYLLYGVHFSQVCMCMDWKWQSLWYLIWQRELKLQPCHFLRNYGTFIPMYVRSQKRKYKYHRWNFCSQELSFPRTFSPIAKVK